MNLVADVTTIVAKLNDQLQESQFAHYWVEANDALVDGYTLPVDIQNILDDVMGGFLNTFQSYDIDLDTLSQNTLKDIANKVDFSALNQIITPLGIKHNYFCVAGVKPEYRIGMDLKIIPTIFDKNNQPVSAITFIALEFEIGSFEYGKGSMNNRIIYLPIINIIGREDLKPYHEPFYQLKTLAVPNLTNEMLGAWLKRLRLLTPEEHITLNEYNGNMF